MDIASIISGGVTGVIGALGSAGIKYFTDKQGNKHALDMREIDLREMSIEAEFASDSSRMDLRIEQERGQAAGFEASQNVSVVKWASGDLTRVQNWFYVCIDLLRGLMRPTITLACLAAAFYVSTESLQDSRETILYLATTTVLWWFGTRVLDKVADKR